MDTSQIVRSPYQRYLHLRELLRTIRERALANQATFSILSYGSASYGYNPKNHGKLDDLDLFMIIPRDTCPDEILGLGRKIFPEGFEMHEAHILHLLKGECEMCRLYCELDGIKVGFRIISHDIFKGTADDSGSTRPIRNIASVGQSRIVTDQEWSFVERTYLPMTYENYSTLVGDEQVLTVLHRVFSSEGTRLGALGRKLLT